MFKQLVFVFFLCSLTQLVETTSLKAQEKEPFSTTNTSKSPSEFHHEKDFKRKKLLSWIKNDTKGTLLGNKCFEEVTQDMGFEYVVQPRGNAQYKSGFSRFMNNFGVKFGILFRNGPFWKFKLKKQRKRCKDQMGDFVG